MAWTLLYLNIFQSMELVPLAGVDPAAVTLAASQPIDVVWAVFRFIALLDDAAPAGFNLHIHTRVVTRAPLHLYIPGASPGADNAASTLGRAQWDTIRLAAGRPLPSPA